MFPRELSTQEQAWIEWLLPTDKLGYKQFREQIEKLVILGEGRWGKNDFILGRIGQEIDLTEKMHPTFAFGFIHGIIIGVECDVTISIHEPNEIGQIEMQISPSSSEEIPYELKELKRWTYSTWKPGENCPATGKQVREVNIKTAGDFSYTLAISPAQKVLWLHSPIDGTNHLIPVTNFYNELMILKQIRDPKVALDHKNLFTYLQQFTDAELIGAFKHYNVLYKKVDIALFDSIPAKKNPLKAIFKKFFHN
jgi:hypothetical protein